jgi:hypothetical protein
VVCSYTLLAGFELIRLKLNENRSSKVVVKLSNWQVLKQKVETLKYGKLRISSDRKFEAE